MGFKTWAAGKQRETIFERAGGRCEFEIMAFGEWVRCSNPIRLEGPPVIRGQAAHIYGRAKHSAKTKFDPVSCLWACHRCHSVYDKNTIGPRDMSVRVPLGMKQAAFDFIMADQWSEQGKREVRVALGPRPEAGEEPY